MCDEDKCEMFTIDRRVLMPKPALRKSLFDGGIAEVVKSTGRRYKLYNGEVLGEAIAAVIEPTMYRPNWTGGCDQILKRIVLAHC